MITLSVDTSTYFGSIAIVEDRKITGIMGIGNQRTHTVRVLPFIDILLEETKRELEEIDLLALSVGPGSFTGLRIGMSTVKALSLSLDIKIAPVSTLRAMSAKIEPRSCIICPVIDARRGEVYTALFKEGDRISKLLCIKPEELTDHLPDSEEVVFYGNGAQRYRSLLEKKGNILDKDLFIASETAKLGIELYEKNEAVESKELTPKYLRPSDAQIS